MWFKTVNLGKLQMGNGCKHIACFCHISSMLKKSWVNNLLPKVSVAERNHLYQWMCQLIHRITQSVFNVMCEELKLEYVDKPSVWQYIEGGSCDLTCAWRKLWPKFGRLFNYGHVDTTNVVERHLQFLKFITLR